MPFAPGKALFRQVANSYRGFMLDECVVQTFVQGAPDAHGTPSESWITSPATRCHLKNNTAKELVGTAQVDAADAMLYLPPGVALSAGDRVSLTKRLRTVLAEPILYTVNGESERGMFGIVAPLKLYTGSDYG